jgi:hypothetical protein
VDLALVRYTPRQQCATLPTRHSPSFARGPDTAFIGPSRNGPQRRCAAFTFEMLGRLVLGG